MHGRRMQTPKVWGECGTYRLTQSAWAHSRPEGPQSQERNRHMWSLGGGSGPTNARFLQLFPFVRFVCLFSISSDANIFCLFVCMWLSLSSSYFFFFFLKNKSHLVLFFCRHRHQGRGRGRHKHATGRPCARGRLGSKHQLCPVKPGAALTAVGPLERPSSGNGHSATCRRGGATHGSLRTGWCGVCPGRRCTV